MSEAIHYNRRRFIGTAVTAVAGTGLFASRLGALEPGSFDESNRVVTKPGTDASLVPAKQIDAGAIVEYVEAGPSNGPAAILLHGAAGGIDSYVDVMPLATSGYRVIVPYARGSDTGHFVSSATMPHDQQTAAPSDVMALVAALKIEKALVGGFDEGARTAEVVAALWPQRLKAIALVSGSVVVTLAANQRSLPPKEELEWWYQYYFLRD